MSMKRKGQSQIRSFRLNLQNKKISNMLVGLEVSTKLQDIKFIGIGNGIIFLHRCRFHYIDHLWIFHGVFISVCLIIVHHGFIIHICGLFVYICAKIILPTGSRQLVSHHLPIMTVLIKKVGLYRKRNTRWSSKCTVSKKMDDGIKILIWYKIKKSWPLKKYQLVLLTKLSQWWVYFKQYSWTTIKFSSWAIQKRKDQREANWSNRFSGRSDQYADRSDWCVQWTWEFLQEQDKAEF